MIRDSAMLVPLIVAALGGCDSGEQPPPVAVSRPSDDRPAQTTVIAEPTVIAKPPSIIDALLKQDGQITFESTIDPSTGGGLKLTLLQDGTAKVDYLGDDSATSTGTYRVENRTRLQLDFGVDDPWLPMELSSVDGSLVINAPDKEQIIQIAVQAGIAREGITEEDVRAAFPGWPLQQASGVEPAE